MQHNSNVERSVVLQKEKIKLMLSGGEPDPLRHEY